MPYAAVYVNGPDDMPNELDMFIVRFLSRRVDVGTDRENTEVFAKIELYDDEGDWQEEAVRMHEHKDKFVAYKNGKRARFVTSTVVE